MDQNIITLIDEDGVETNFFILEETKLAGNNYILVTDAGEDDEEAEALILLEKTDEDDNLTYSTVEDENTLKALSGIFEELLDDISIIS